MPEPGATPTPAAVLMPFYLDADGAPRIVLIERTPHGRHGGQIALPGGKWEPVDATMRDTAIRETCEELGVTSDTLEVLDELPALQTRSTGFLVWPFVGRLRAVPPQWRPQEREVASVLDLAVTDLLDPAVRDEENMHFPTWKVHMRVPVWRIPDHIIWGLTLRILEPVLPRIMAGDYPI
ncbi:MAG TPA: CoA pyrophosphatase [Pseudonocardia sp.]